MLRERGIEFVAVRSSVVCTERLNHARKGGKNRFVSDLHAMEALVLELRRMAGENVTAVCGKVGGIGEYSRYFGPLGGWLHSILGEAQAKSAYHFPTIGELRFVRDADGFHFFKGRADDDLMLYYGQPDASPPRYDLSLVAGQLLSAQRHPATLVAEEQLRSAPWSETRLPGTGGVLFWSILGMVVIGLLVVIARLLPKSSPPP